MQSGPRTLAYEEGRTRPILVLRKVGRPSTPSEEFVERLVIVGIRRRIGLEVDDLCNVLT